VELNKVTALAGLTVLTFVFLFRGDPALSTALLWHAMLLLWAHTAYSTYKYYGDKNFPALSSFPAALAEWRSPKSKDNCAAVKKLSIALGAVGQLALSAGYWQHIGRAALALGGVGVGVAHFYTMEIDFKYVLQVRPYAFLPFPLAALAIWNALSGL